MSIVEKVLKKAMDNAVCVKYNNSTDTVEFLFPSYFDETDTTDILDQTEIDEAYDTAIKTIKEVSS